MQVEQIAKPISIFPPLIVATAVCDLKAGVRVFHVRSVMFASDWKWNYCRQAENPQTAISEFLEPTLAAFWLKTGWLFGVARSISPLTSTQIERVLKGKA